MREFRAADLTRNTGDLFEAAALAPVAITKHRKPRFVVMSMQQYEAMTSDHGSQVAVDVADSRTLTVELPETRFYAVPFSA